MFNVAGLILNLIGVLILFRYGMPFRIETGGASLLGTEDTVEGLRADQVYRRLGYAGLVSVIVGTLLQCFAAWPAT